MTIEELKEFGVNTDEGLSRCLNNEEFYFRMIRLAASDTGFNKLKDAVENHDLATAFEAAHALKGVLGNLSITPLFVPLSEITELLREKKDMDYSVYLEEIERKKEALKKLCR